LHGFLNINKPTGMTSFDVIRKIRQIIPRGVKIGHLGTLDPMASGVLPIALGKATRIIPYIEDEKKSYIAELTLGAISDTQDAWGQITYTGNTKFAVEDLQAILKQFSGTIKQIPPMYSAVHHQGKRLYEYAREGISVTRREREINIYSLQVLKIDKNSALPVIKLKIDCSRGTYIRTLCNDIGAQLGTGGLMSSLVRIYSGGFNIEQACPLEKIANNKLYLKQHLMPLDYPLQSIPAISIDSWQDIRDVMNGRAITLANKNVHGLLRLYNPEGKLIALARNTGDQGTIKPERVFK